VDASIVMNSLRRIFMNLSSWGCFGG
jgi:hypothetical protein